MGQDIDSTDMPLILPVLPLRDVVVYPYMVIPLFVGREKSIQALDAAMQDNKQILLVAQRSADVDDPQPADLYEVGTLANILQLLKLPDGTVKVLVEGGERARLSRFVEGEEYFTAETAAALNRSARSIDRDWTRARLYLYRDLNLGDGNET